MTRRLLQLAALALSTVGLLACTTPSQAPTEPVPLRVIAFNDFHGHLEPGALTLTLADPAQTGQTLRVATGGADALAGLVDRLRAQTRHSVLVSTGDLIGAAPLISTLFGHESTMEVANRIGVDVATPGNHEFDAGQNELLRLLKGGCADTRPQDAVRSCALNPYTGARFPMVSANVRQSNGTLLPPSWVTRVEGIPVGFIGAVTRVTPQIVMPSGVEGLTFEDEAQAINRAAAQLQAQGVQALVVMLHEGAEVGQPGRPVDWNDAACPGLRGEAAEIIRRISPAVDLIFTAHTHQGYNCRIDDRPVMQATAYGRGLSVVDLHLDRRSGDVIRSRTQSRNLPVFNDRTDPTHRARLLAAEPEAFAAALTEARPNTAVRQQVQRYAQAAEPLARRVVGRIGQALDRRGPFDSSVGRLVADAQWEATRNPQTGGAHFALMNPGGLRSDLACPPPGPCDITYGDLFTLQPFGNSLVVMSLTGTQVRELLEQQQRGGPQAPLMSPSAALTYRWNRQAPLGQRAQDIRVNGQALDPKATYRVTVNSFMAEGGDGYTVLQRGGQRTGGPQDLDALIDYLKRHSPTSGNPRITEAN